MLCEFSVSFKRSGFLKMTEASYIGLQPSCLYIICFILCVIIEIYNQVIMLSNFRKIFQPAVMIKQQYIQIKSAHIKSTISF